MLKELEETLGFIKHNFEEFKTPVLAQIHFQIAKLNYDALKNIESKSIKNSKKYERAIIEINTALKILTNYYKESEYQYETF
mmetsp:Transcript_25519/g.22543  ORF Transcript_25519/g.22543 Transcript_25519/m.22543 type:complete len:82 (-) Transcript_25519:573-818(-)